MATIKTILNFDLNTNSYYPKPVAEELTSHEIEGPYKITLEADSQNTINLTDKGTIKRILLTVADGIEDVRARINSAQILRVQPILLLGTGITALRLDNTNLEDAWDIEITLIYT